MVSKTKKQKQTERKNLRVRLELQRQAAEAEAAQQMKRVRILALTHVVLGCDRDFSFLFHASTADLKTTAWLTISHVFFTLPKRS